MHRRTCGYYGLFSASLARRCLQRLTAPLDPWQAHFLRRCCDYLRRGMPEAAISAWNFMDLPPDRRGHVAIGILPAGRLADEEIGQIRAMLADLLAQDDHEAFTLVARWPSGAIAA